MKRIGIWVLMAIIVFSLTGSVWAETQGGAQEKKVELKTLKQSIETVRSNRETIRVETVEVMEKIKTLRAAIKNQLQESDALTIEELKSLKEKAQNLEKITVLLKKDAQKQREEINVLKQALEQRELRKARSLYQQLIQRQNQRIGHLVEINKILDELILNIEHTQ